MLLISRLFKGCTDFLDPSAKPWCSTEVDAEGRHIGGQGSWGECKDVCYVDNEGTILKGNGKEMSIFSTYSQTVLLYMQQITLQGFFSYHLMPWR